ncbi:MAG: DegQ family serine endoprotease [Mariprofundaceae bacterium]|nr:DegQ family serine endoprotease [Mariprofundaceae bacterium]
MKTYRLILAGILMMLPAISQAMPESFADLAAAQKQSVVNISTTKLARARPMPQMPFGSPFDELFRDMFRNQQPEERHSLGSGFILSKDGYVITNNHVVDGADEVVVKNSEGDEFKAEVIGTDAKLDLALLKIEAKGLRGVKLGDSDQLRVGDWVVAIGNPFGLEQTVTAGIVSAKGRVIGAGPYDNFIQTDAAINPGNSGGPLFNAKGEVVGINTAIYSRSGGNNGIGFAIPINLAHSVFDELRESGRVQRARLGVMIRDIDKETMKALGLKNRHGALIPQVESGSAADKAGIQAGDVIVRIDEHEIRQAHDLPIRVARHKPGDRVQVEIIRDGKSITIPVVVEAMPEDQVAEGSRQQSSKQAAVHGLSLKALTPEVAESLRVRASQGVVVQQIMRGSPGFQAGIEPGDVIVKVNGRVVTTPESFDKHAEVLADDVALRVLIDRHGDQVFTVIYPPRK